MAMWTIWLILAACLAIVEVLTLMMWSLCLTLGALGAMTGALCGLGLGWQCVILLAVGMVAYIALLPVLKRRQARTAQHQERTGMEALLGRHAVVTETILPGRLGRARIDGDSWLVKAPGLESAVQPGTQVVVTAYESIILTVSLNDAK